MKNNDSKFNQKPVPLIDTMFMKLEFIILPIILLCAFSCEQKKSANSNYQKSDTSFIVPFAPRDKTPIIINNNRPPTENDVDSFMTYKTRESYYNLNKRYDMADCMNEFLFFAVVAADKFNISHAYCHIAGCLTNYFSYISISTHSKEIATYYLKRGALKKDESCINKYKSIDKYLERETRKLWIPEKNISNPIVSYKANSLLGKIEDYNQLKQYLMEKDKPEDLLFYSYIMADRYGYEPARNDVVDAMNRGYKKYKLGKLGKDAKYFCSFFQEKHEN